MSGFHSSQIGSSEMGDGAGKELIRILSEFANELPEKYLTYNVGLMLAGATATVNETQNGGSVTGKCEHCAERRICAGAICERYRMNRPRSGAEAKMRTIVAKRYLPKMGGGDYVSRVDAGDVARAKPRLVKENAECG